MSRKLLSTKVTVLYATIITFMLLGCATPYESRHEISTQKKMQAAHHWDVLAEDVAEHIAQRIGKEMVKEYKPVFIETSPDTPFEDSFGELLATHLVNLGIKVLENFEPNSMVGKYNVKVIRHSAGRTELFLTTSNSVFYALSNEIVVKRGGEAKVKKSTKFETDWIIGGLPHTEVIITTSIVDKNAFITRDTAIYYINDPDFWHYENLPVEEPRPLPNLKVSNKF